MEIKKSVVQTLGQLAAWGVLLLIIEEICLIFDVRLRSAPGQIISYFGVPIAAGIIFCYLMNKSSFKFKYKFSSNAVYILLSRICAIFLFLLLGVVLDSLNARNWLANFSDSKYTELIANFLGSLNVYIIISLFPLSYGVMDFIFVEK